jgi:hypothetical protein
MEKRVREIVLPSVIYVSFLTLTVWFLVLQETIIPLDILGYDLTLSLSFLGVPMIAFLSIKYSSFVAEKLLVGRATGRLSEGLNTVAYAAFLYYASDWSLAPSWINPLIGFLLFATMLSALHDILGIYIRDVNYIFEPILTSIYILLVGFLGSQTWLSVYPFFEELVLASPFSGILLPIIRAGLAEPVNNVIIISTAITAVLSLTGVFKNHPNPYLEYLGSNIGGQIEKVTLLNFTLIYYLFFVRWYLLESSGINPEYVVMGEWVAICFFFYVSYRSMKRYAEESLVRQDVIGTWRKHLQRVDMHTDSQQEHLSDLVEGFIDKGVKKGLIIHLTLLFTNSSLEAPSITRTLSPLIEHNDMEPPRIGFPWQADHVAELNKQRRRKIVNTVLSSIQLKPLTGETEGEEAESEITLEV